MKRSQATNPSYKAENREAMKRNEDKNPAYKAKYLEAAKRNQDNNPDRRTNHLEPRKKIRPRHVTCWSPIKVILLQTREEYVRMTMGWFLVDWMTLNVSRFHC